MGWVGGKSSAESLLKGLASWLLGSAQIGRRQFTLDSPLSRSKPVSISMVRRIAD